MKQQVTEEEFLELDKLPIKSSDLDNQIQSERSFFQLYGLIENIKLNEKIKILSKNIEISNN